MAKPICAMQCNKGVALGSHRAINAKSIMSFQAFRVVIESCSLPFAKHGQGICRIPRLVRVAHFFAHSCLHDQAACCPKG